MPAPQPAVVLKDHCSVIYNNTLYTYQPNAFQSLDLSQGAKWTQLPMGVTTNGSICVQGSVNNQDSLLVVGGSTSTPNYQGLQHYSFQTKTWQTDSPVDTVEANRQRHGAAFLQQSSSILTYGGSQYNEHMPSSQTFLISTTSPYNIQAFESDATPVTSPLMLPWNTTHALMLGGDPSNTKLFTFGPQDGWKQLGVSLQHGLKDSSKVQATIISGTDGSKVLEIFDMGTSPNQITTLLLQNATSNANKANANKPRSYIPSQHHPAKRRKRDTTLADRPAYNSTLAPQGTRSAFSLASDPKTGLVVATGGNSQEPLSIFNQTGNQWVDPSLFFGNEPSPTATVSPSSVPLGSPTTSSAPPPAATSASKASTDKARNRSLTILGSVLGGIFGLVILLVLVLLLLRYCRKRRERRRRHQSNTYRLEDKGEMDFADVGADFMKEAGGSFAGSNHRRNRSNRSNPRVGLRAANERGGAISSMSKRGLLHAKDDSAGSSHSFWSRNTKSPEKSPPQISAPIMGPHPGKPLVSPDTRTEPRTADTGWSRYFINNNSTEMLSNMPPGGSEEIRPDTQVSNSQTHSDYTSSRGPSSHPHASAEVEPLNFRASQGQPPNHPPNTRVMSPTGSRPGLGVALTHGASLDPEEAPPTPSSFVSDIEEEDLRHLSHESDGQDSWTPVASAGERSSTWTDDRPVSSVYANSDVYPHPGERVRIPNFPMPNSVRNSQTTLRTSPSANPGNRGLRNIASRDFAGTDDSRRQTAWPEVRTGTQWVTPSTVPQPLPGYGASEVRTFPRKNEELGARARGSSQTEDMSWLNLGMSAEQNPGSLNNNNLVYFPGR